MIRSLLIANRGEIAVRIIRTCKRMNIESVAVYSTADAESLHVKMADRAICIGGSHSHQSYLHVQNIISAALKCGCDAIHPGVGFLSESALFAEAVENSGLIFIGPASSTIKSLGDKITSRNIAVEANIPVTPGSMESITSLENAHLAAQGIGYPILLKASGGGGGRGMRVVNSPKELESALAVATQEALSFFSNGAIHIEKYLTNARHIEIQLLSDESGDVIHLGERDCTVQHNHQKLIEESPSPTISETLRSHMIKDAKRLFKNLRYSGAGTVEFLVDGDAYYFMEVNARLQVEHPVTEQCTNIDLIRQQLLIASTRGLPLSQDEIFFNGHALECRIVAKEVGEITHFSPPLGLFVRCDTHLYRGFTVTAYYDSLLAKIIVHTPNRQQSIETMCAALKEMTILGVKTNIEEQLMILNSKEFRSAHFDTTLYSTLCVPVRSTP